MWSYPPSSNQPEELIVVLASPFAQGQEAEASFCYPDAGATAGPYERARTELSLDGAERYFHFQTKETREDGLHGDTRFVEHEQQ
jgi:hypothetical protein